MSTIANSLIRTVRTLTLGSVVVGGLVYGLSPQDDLKVYYGLLHAHTLISDGSGTPEEAFKSAKDNKLDFFAVTPHSHEDAESGAKERKDGILIATNQALYNGAGLQTITRTWKENNTIKTEEIKVKPLLQAAAEATTSTFVALYGQEFSTISSGNHVNVLGINKVITSPNGDFKSLINLLKSEMANGEPLPLLQLNHPDASQDLFYKGENKNTKKNMFNDYGVDEIDFGPHFKDVSDALNPYVSLIEVLSGPAMKKERITNYHYSSHENDYFFYLKQGFRLAPSAGQDNHYKTWGSVTDARIGVLAEKLTSDDLYKAMRMGRTFVTEDKNLQAILYVNNQVMGSAIIAGEETELKINVKLIDADESNTSYSIELYGGEITPELSTKATNWKASDGKLGEMEVNGDAIYFFSGQFASPKPYFIYAKIIQDDGDRAWTAPVWINSSFGNLDTTPTVAHNGTIYFWTKTASSKVYHLDGCTSVDRINPENLTSGENPPVGRSLHNCSVRETTGH